MSAYGGVFLLSTRIFLKFSHEDFHHAYGMLVQLIVQGAFDLALGCYIDDRRVLHAPNLGLGLGEPSEVILKCFVQLLSDSEQASGGYWLNKGALEVAAE